MIKLQYYFPILLMAIGWISCQEETNSYLDGNAPAPAQITDIKVEATPGGAIITYKIPIDPNLSYVKALYDIQPGVFREAKSSYYTDTLALVGFGDTLSHDVKIYSVGKNEKESEPLSVNVKPLIPPVEAVFKTLTLDPTFSGVRVTFQNVTQADLSVVILVDSTGLNKWTQVSALYSKGLIGNFYGRGKFAPTEKMFAVFVRDRWNNKSDTLIKSLAPWAEQQINRALYKVYKLPGDSWAAASANYPLEEAFNGIVNVGEDIFATADDVKLPQWFTIDLNQKTAFSRMKIHQRINYPYNGVWVLKFSIWGSNAPDADGGWTNWVKLGSFTSIKPSGLAGNLYDANDMAFVTAGEDFNFEGTVPAVRYMRFVMEGSRAGVGKYQLGEFTFWGSVIP